MRVAESKVLEVDQLPGFLLVRVLPRRIFLELADRFREDILRLANESSDPLVLDLSQVSVMNSTALGTLVVLSDAMRKSGRPFYVIRPGKILREVLTRMRLDLLLAIRDDLDAVYAELEGKTG
ncbi:MAG: STAS domain-containing protein [candidate division KSB1 bacterium]|nr:STAS domain-containing protein [candidate division KSB1 bacterium]